MQKSLYNNISEKSETMNSYLVTQRRSANGNDFISVEYKSGCIRLLEVSQEDLDSFITAELFGYNFPDIRAMAISERVISNEEYLRAIKRHEERLAKTGALVSALSFEPLSSSVEAWV